MPTTPSNWWKKVKLGEVVEIKKRSFNPKNWENIKYIWIEHIEQWTLVLIWYWYSNETTSMKTYFSKWDILFGKIRPYFSKVVKAHFDWVCSTEIFVLHSTEWVYNDFIFYYLANLDFIDKVTKSCWWVDRPIAKWEVIKEFEILLPSLPIQQKITSIKK